MTEYSYRLDEEGNLTLSEKVACQHALAVLVRHYPGWTWGVAVEGGVLTVRCRNLLTAYGVRLKLSECDDVQIMLAGGELLARFRQPRADLRRHSLPEQPRSRRGHLVPEM